MNKKIISRRDIKFRDEDILFDGIFQTRKFYAQTIMLLGNVSIISILQIVMYGLTL